jgi:hypothetical protein
MNGSEFGYSKILSGTDLENFDVIDLNYFVSSLKNTNVRIRV